MCAVSGDSTPGTSLNQIQGATAPILAPTGVYLLYNIIDDVRACQYENKDTTTDYRSIDTVYYNILILHILILHILILHILILHILILHR